MIHKGAFLVGALVVKGVVAAGHAVGHVMAANAASQAAAAKLVAAPIVKGVAAHPIISAFIGAGALATPIVTIAYLDKEAAMRILSDNPGGASARIVKVSVAGNLINGEFRTITGPLNNDRDVILLGRYDENQQKMIESHLIKPNRVEPRLANAYAGGNVVVFA